MICRRHYVYIWISVECDMYKWLLPVQLHICVVWFVHYVWSKSGFNYTNYSMAHKCNMPQLFAIPASYKNKHGPSKTGRLVCPCSNASSFFGSHFFPWPCTIVQLSYFAFFAIWSSLVVRPFAHAYIFIYGKIHRKSSQKGKRRKGHPHSSGPSLASPGLVSRASPSLSCSTHQASAVPLVSSSAQVRGSPQKPRGAAPSRLASVRDSLFSLGASSSVLRLVEHAVHTTIRQMGWPIFSDDPLLRDLVRGCSGVGQVPSLDPRLGPLLGPLGCAPSPLRAT